MVIYLDVIFLNHYVINRILLLWLQAFFPYHGPRIRKEAGLLCMALCQIPEEVLYLQGGPFAVILLFELLASLVLFLGIYRIKQVSCFFRIMLVYFTGSLILGGLFRALWELPAGEGLTVYAREHSMVFYGLLLLFTGVLELLLLVSDKQRDMAVWETSVEVWLGKNHFHLRGYMDSGNMLTDALTGKPVLVGSYRAFQTYLPKEHQYIIKEFLRRGGMEHGALFTEPPSGFRWMVCNSVGINGRILPLLTADKVRYVMNKRVVESVRQPVLLFDGDLMEGAYDVLLNKEL